MGVPAAPYLGQHLFASGASFEVLVTLINDVIV